MSNSWLVLQAQRSSYADVTGRAYEYPSHIPNASRLSVGDSVVIAVPAEEAVDEGRITGLGRIGRIEEKSNGRRVALFDRFAQLAPSSSFEDVGGDPRRNKSNSINAIDQAVVDRLLQRIGLTDLRDANAVALAGDDPPVTKDANEVREEIFDAVLRDLLGPAEGPEEELVAIGIRDRYLVGQLAPHGLSLDPSEIDERTPAGGGASEEGQPDVNTPQRASLMPSSIGMTFAVDGSVDRIRAEVSWGQYQRVRSETELTESGRGRAVWKRFPRGGSADIEMDPKKRIHYSPDEEVPAVHLEGRVRKIDGGDWVVTLFLVNGQQPPPKEAAPDRQKEEEFWLYQPELKVKSADGAAVFRKRPDLEESAGAETLDQREQRGLSMQYRNRVEFAVGHGVAVHAEVNEEQPEAASEIVTRFIPWHDIAVTEPPNERDFPGLADLVLDMKQLSETPVDSLIESLSVLPTEYGKWILEQSARLDDDDLADYKLSALEALEDCRRTLQRLEEGIAVLGSNDQALTAFRFANRAMYLQRVRSEYVLRTRRGQEVALGDLDSPKNRSWYPFQLAYLLLNVPALADPKHRDRTSPTDSIADLLWFPTGGGKTEAYLGVAAFAMAMRRLQGEVRGYEGGRGVAVIMRYTLRLLTIQQFQRASTLLCAMEVIRRDALAQGDPTWGTEPFRIGLWVGARASPNTTKDSENALKEAKSDSWTGGGGGTPYQLTNCPWCGRRLDPGRDLSVDKTLERTFMFCSDQLGGCEFSPKQSKKWGGLPVLVVDEEIYRLLPDLLIGTVDKFAQMPWKGDVANLFGRVSKLCLRHGYLSADSADTGRHTKKGVHPKVEPVQVGPLRPPDLIIQDELHLISGPLGSMVGLYESAVDELCEWTIDDAISRPKVIASTATIRRAKDQIHGIFLRSVNVFPPRGIDIEDNFFARERALSADKPGRRYFGICAPGRSRPAVLIRVYVALLSAAQAAYEKYGASADPWMTLVGYFNSLRELGGMRRLVEDDVRTRAFRVNLKDELLRPGLAGRQIGEPQELTSRRTSADIPKILDWLEEGFSPEVDQERQDAKQRKERARRRAIDVLLATNMVSVGVDVRRLGLMVVAGQPKNTAEYIQATSRVGRASPGLVCTVLNWARPRDLSHYERFEHYHSTFYQYVEALSVTPFAKRALDRGLTGLLVALLRLNEPELMSNGGAEHFDRHAAYSDDVVEQLATRAWNVTDDKAAQEIVATTLEDRLDQWAHEAGIGGRRLVYKAERGGTSAPLLQSPGSGSWEPFTLLNSLRDVEPTVYLIKTGEDGGRPEPDWVAPLDKDSS
jgi:hypothetical protein